MNKIATIIFASILILWEIPLLSQKEANIWYFGDKAGLDFSTSPPTVLTDGAIDTQEGSASVTDVNGNLLFYTDGVTIWDRTHNIMPNGSGLLGGQSTTQAALILLKPQSNHLYYVFCLDANGGVNGLTYSVVDMNLALGNGSVTVKNIQLHNISEEKLAATLHANGTDMWIVTHDYNSDKFRSFMLGTNGVQVSAVLSATGINHASETGQLKISPLGNKIALASPSHNGFELYDFNNSSGQVTNGIILVDSIASPYGCEFSASGARLYGVSGFQSVRQWDLCSPSTAAIISSQKVVHSSTLMLGSIQLGPDKKIYVGHYLQPTLDVIADPDKLGLACNYLENSLNIAPGICKLGLPNFPTWPFGILNTLSLNLNGHDTLCAGETKVVDAAGADTYSWNGVGGGPSYTVQPAVTSVYTVTGTFSVGCPIGSTFTIDVDPCTAVEENDYLSDPKILCKNGSILVSNIPAGTPCEIRVHNLDGQIIYTDQFYEGNDIEISDPRLMQGIYIISIFSSKKIHRSKILMR